jgi:penicillin-binding protein 1A
VEIWSRFMQAAHQGVPPQPFPGGVWQGFGPSSAPMAENNGWPSLPGDLPARVDEAAQAPPAPIHGGIPSGAPVPPADIPNPGVFGQKRGAQSGKQDLFDTLFGG